jgi:hypothetical protein
MTTASPSAFAVDDSSALFVVVAKRVATPLRDDVGIEDARETARVDDPSNALHRRARVGASNARVTTTRATCPGWCVALFWVRPRPRASKDDDDGTTTTRACAMAMTSGERVTYVCD